MKKDKHKYHSIRKPGFRGGKEAFTEFLRTNQVYPKEALEKKIEGMVHVKCEISDRGKMLSAQIVHGLGSGLDEEALRLCKLMIFGDTTERGFKIRHTRVVKIPFALPKAPALTISYETTPSDKKSGSYNYTIKF